MIRVALPPHLRTLARTGPEIEVRLEGAATQSSLLDAVEAAYPMLRGTIRDRETRLRRQFLRFFACERDLSLDHPDTPLPAEVTAGTEPFLIVGAIAGG